MKPVIDFERRNIFGPASHVAVPAFINISNFSSIFRDTFPPEQYIPGEAHSDWEVVRVVEGERSVMVEGKIIPLEPDEVYVYAPYTYHGGRERQEVMTLEIFAFSSDSPALSRLGNRVFKLTERQRQLFDTIIERGRNYRKQYPLVYTKEREYIFPEEGYPLLQTLANLMELFLIDLYETDLHPHYAKKPRGKNAERYQDERFERLTRYLESHIRENLTLEQICQDINVGAATLQKLCNKLCGCGPISYFLTLKIRLAKQMIAGTSKNFSQIAEELGFSSIHYFSNLFKSRTGISPSAYAKAIKKQ